MNSSHRDSAEPRADVARAGSPPDTAASSYGATEAFASSRIGQTLCGKYLLERVLGVGGMAAVYAATHRNRKQFAIKILHPALSAGDGIRQRFLREGYVANSVRHPGAVAVLDDDVAEDGSAFLVMELLDGKSLEDIWAMRGGALPARTALCLIAQVLDVLSAAHKHGILHRDLKPPNLFLTREGMVKVLDFGIARLQEATSQKLTSTGMTLGTPAFMAPEQVMGKTDEIDARADIWAVGATLFVLLSGQLVHDGENSQQLMIYAATRPARSLAEVGADFPQALVALVDKALSFEKESRFQSAAAMRLQLDAVHRALFGVPVSVILTDPSAAELCEAPEPELGSGPPVREAALGEKSGARRAVAEGVAAARALPPVGAPEALSSEIRPVPGVAVAPSPALAERAAAAPMSTPPAAAPTPPAAAHVEVNIAQVQSARLPWGIAAVATAVVLFVLAGAVMLLAQRHGSMPSVRNETEEARTRAPAGAVPTVAPAPQAPEENPARSGARAPQPRALVQPAESVSSSERSRPLPRGPAAPAPRPLSSRCLGLLERQSLGEPLNAEERTHLIQRCRR